MGKFPSLRGSSSLAGPAKAIFAVSVILALLATGCADPKTPDLLEVNALGPPLLEPSSELRIDGNGFPEGRPGHLTLEGVVFTPARPPREVEWQLPLVADSRTQIVLRPSIRDLQELTEGASHATFRGEAIVVFAPLVDGRPPLRGRKNDLVLDLFTRAGTPADPEPFLTFLGMEVSADLVVSRIMKDSIAARSGLREGDQLHVLDGVRLDSRSDLLPQARASTSVVSFSRKGFRDLLDAQLPHAGFQLMDHTLAARALALLLGICLALIWAARPPRFLVWLFGERSLGRRGRVVWLPSVPERWQGAAYPLFLAIIVGYFWLLRHESSLLSGLDFVGLLAAGGLSSLMAAFLLGGLRSTSLRFSLLGAFGQAVLRLVILLPVLIASLFRASDSGSLRLVEIAGAQGMSPTHWALFESPFSFLLGLCFLVALLPLSGRRAPLEGHPGQRGRGVFVARLLEWTGHLTLLSLWVCLYAGAPWTPTTSLWLAGALLSGKVALLAHAVAWTRARMGNLRSNESLGLFGLGNLLVSSLAAGLGFGFVVLGLQETHAELLGLFSASLSGALFVLLFIGSKRSWAHMGRRIDPWI